MEICFLTVYHKWLVLIIVFFITDSELLLICKHCWGVVFRFRTNGSPRKTDFCYFIWTNLRYFQIFIIIIFDNFFQSKKFWTKRMLDDSLLNDKCIYAIKLKKDEEKNEKEVNTLALSRGRYACSRPESTHHTIIGSL